MSGPALGVISQAIKLWLKSVCSQLEHLDLSSAVNRLISMWVRC